MFAVTLVVLLLASINYQLNLGYLLTFVLAGSGVVSMHLTHATLRGLTLHLHPVAPVHAGDAALLEIVLTSAGRGALGHRPARAIGDAGRDSSWIDVPAGGAGAGARQLRARAAAACTSVPTLRRRDALPARPVPRLGRSGGRRRSVLVYPRPSEPAAPLPAAHAIGRGAAQPSRAQRGRRVRRRARLPPRRPAQAGASGRRRRARSRPAASSSAATPAPRRSGSSGSTGKQCGASWRRSAAVAPGRLGARRRQRAGVDYGLRLPGRELPPAHGEAHRRACLEALALWQ